MTNEKITYRNNGRRVQFSRDGKKWENTVIYTATVAEAEAIAKAKNEGTYQIPAGGIHFVSEYVSIKY